MKSILLLLAPLVQTPAPDSVTRSRLTPDFLSWFDLDADGDLDALVRTADGSLLVHRNLSRGSYEEVTIQAGLSDVTGVREILAGDADGDGADDIILAGSFGLQLWRQSEGRFYEESDRFGLDGLGPVRAVEWVDADGDGHPYLHLAEGGRQRVLMRGPDGVFQELDLGLDRGPEAIGTSVTVRSAQARGGALDADGGSTSRDPERGAPRQFLGTVSPDRDPGFPEMTAPVRLGSPSVASGPASTDLLGCVHSLKDQAGGACIQASSVPTEGMLYPLGPEFFVDAATGNVGVGTTTPEYGLEVVGQIVSGTDNAASGLESAMGGGALNTASGVRATVAGGESNFASGEGAFVGGGLSNSALSQRAAIAGGVGNRAAYRAFVGGGDTNSALANFTTVPGGKLNEARQTGGAVGGGENNVSDGSHATIAGGFGNAATGSDSAVAGGRSNFATADYGAIPGGRNNTAAGAYSLAAGRRAKSLHDGAFVWADSTDADVTSTAPDQFLVQASGGMGVGRVPDPAIQLDVEGVVRASDTLVSTKATGTPISVVSTDVNPNLNADLLDGFHATAFSTFGAQVDSAELADDAVTNSKIAAGAVGSTELAASAVTPAALAPGAITAASLATDAVVSDAIAADAVGASELAPDSVTGAEVVDGTLTEADVAFGSLTVAGEIESTAGGFRFPDGSLQASASGAGSGVPGGAMILSEESNAISGFVFTGLKVDANRAASGWESKTGATQGRRGHASVNVEYSVYVVGGLTSGGLSDSLARYDTVSDSWSTLEPMPGGDRAYVGVAAARVGADNRLFAIGGRDNSEPLSRCEEYSSVADLWTTCLEMDHPRHAPAVVGGQGLSEIYVIGGVGDESGILEVTDYVEKYDLVTRLWTELAPMPTPRAGAVAGVIDGKIYVAGGATDCNQVQITAPFSQLVATDVVEVYDIATDTWTTVSPLPSPMVRHAGVAAAGSFYVVGAGGGGSTPCYRLTPNGAWSSTPPLSTSGERTDLSLTVADGQLWAFGGDVGLPTPTDRLDAMRLVSTSLYVHSKL